MMFLTGGEARTHHAARARQWVLLILRMGVVGLLAVALARPVINARYASVPTAGLNTGGSAAVVIILNDSASMGYTVNGKSRLDQAREVTLQILSALKRGDQAALLITGARDAQPPSPPSTDLQSIADKVANLQPDAGQVDFAADILRAADLLERAKPADHEIYLVTDHQALHWKAVNNAFKQRWSARRASSPPVRVTVFPVGGDEADNVAVDSIEFPDKVIIRDQPADLQVKVHNYGPDACAGVPVSVWTGTQKSLGNTIVAVPAHSTRIVNFGVRFNEPGSHVISAKVESNGLTSDDRLDYSLDVFDPLKVLLVENEGATTRPAGRLSLQSMLMPIAASGRRGVDPAVVTSISQSQLTADLLKKSSVVILNDIAVFSGDQIKSLQQFATGGGGVLFLPGEGVAERLKGNPVYQGGSELLPVPLQPPVSPAKPKLGLIAGFDRQNPVFRFTGILPDPFARLTTSRYFPVDPRGKDIHILARFGPNAPFLIESSIGRGKVLLMTTPADPNWNSLVQSNLFQNLLQSMVRHLGNGAVVERNLWPGQAINVTVDEPVQGVPTVQFSTVLPRDPAVVNRVSDHTEIHYTHTNRPGIYRLQYRAGGKETNLSYVVNIGHADADLTLLTAEQWRTLADGAGFDRVDLARTSVAEEIENHRGGREIWIELLGGVLVLMMMEMLLSRRFSTKS